jgi:phosphatidylglycerophosphate synthase
MNESKEAEKQIPSIFENAFARLTDRWADHLPGRLSPNQITAMGLAAGLLGAACYALAGRSRWLFLGAILGVFAHIVADNLDGFHARKWNKCSQAGAYFDILSDVLVTTFCLIAIGLGGYASFQIVLFLVPLYGIYYITALHSIYLVGVFPFPRMGPFEVHASFALIALLNLIFGTVTFSVAGIGLYLTDVVLLGGLLIEAFELTELTVKLVRALNGGQADGRQG